MAVLTLTSQMDSRNRVLCSPDTELKEIVLEALRLMDFDANIRKVVRRDLDHAALAAKKQRLIASAESIAATPALEGLGAPTVEEFEALAPEDLVLNSGRPRALDGEAALIVAMCRAHLGSLTANAAVDRIRDSIAVRAYFATSGMPCRSAMHGWVNCISEESYEYIMNAQLRMIQKEGLDDFTEVTADSFSVWADTAWPTDSNMILRLLSRAWHYADKLPRFDLPTFSTTYIPLWLQRIRELDRHIAFAAGKPHSKRKIRRLYRQLCDRAQQVLRRLDRQMEGLLPVWQGQTSSLSAFRRQRAEAILNQIASDLAAAAHVVSYARKRVLEGIQIPTAEKILSLSDHSAAYIKKGGRDPVVGYKPQVMRSRDGFITAFELQTGNPADSARLVPLTWQHIERTGIAPSTVSVDDGYSSRINRKALQDLQVDIISMNGSTGKRVTPQQEWESDLYKQARNKRSAVESLVFTLRFKFHLYRFSRRGISAVRAEFYEKAIAHNLWRAVLLRKRAAAQEPPQAAAGF